jgi:hypothetical protein
MPLSPKYLEVLRKLDSTELECVLIGQLSIMNEAQEQITVLLAEKEKRQAEGRWIVYEKELAQYLNYNGFGGNFRARSYTGGGR